MASLLYRLGRFAFRRRWLVTGLWLAVLAAALTGAAAPVVALLVAAAALGIVAVPALDLRLGMPDDGTAAPDTTQRRPVVSVSGRVQA